MVDIKLLESLTPRLKQVAQYVASADAEARAIPSLPSQRFEKLRQKTVEEATRAESLATRALSVVRLVPSFFGGEGERTYFVAFQQNAALRGTGGSILAFALLKIQDGSISLDQFGSIYVIDDRFHGIHTKYSPAVQWYVTNAAVNPRIANGVNYSPDFPVVADSWKKQVEEVTGERVDGAIALDPFAVGDLLKGSPPINVQAFPRPITSDNVVQVVEHDQFELPATLQKEFPGQLIGKAFSQLLLHPRDVVGMLHRMGAALQQKRIQIWTDQTAQQAFLQGLGWDGALGQGPGDYLNLVQNNRVGNKIDWWGTQKDTYTVTVNADGSVDSAYKVELTNGIPTDILATGDPGQVGPPRLRGIARDMMSLYVPKNAKFKSVDPTQVTGPHLEEVHPPGFVEHGEGAFEVLTQTITAGPGETAPLTFTYSVPGVIQTTAQGKVYQLTVQHQPLVNPADFTVQVTLPKGATPLDAVGWTVKGNVATFHTTLTKDLVLRLVF